MPNDKYVVGFVSSPHPHSPSHMRTLEVLDSVEAVHLCGVAGEDTDALSEGSTKVISTTDSVEELVGRDEVDALIVSVRNDLGPDILNAAVDAGKGVLFEKPGVLHASDLRSVAEKAAAKGVTAAIMFQNRYQPKIADARRSIQSGAVGKIMAAEARMVTSQVRYRNPGHWLFKKGTGGSGILGWLGCHHIDLLCNIMDDRIAEVSAFVANQSPEKLEVEDTAMLSLRFESGVLGSMHAGYHLAGSGSGYHGASYDSFLAFRGTDGYARIQMEDDYYQLFSMAPGWLTGGLRKLSFTPPDSQAYGGLGGEIFVDEFLAAARAGRPAPIPIEAGVHVLDVIEAALESSETGRAVTVGP